MYNNASLDFWTKMDVYIENKNKIIDSLVLKIEQY
tara:strand:+ start:958 stop:1062 length:105 start_codon:yes stop_codon:yes gene_type:complete